MSVVPTITEALPLPLLRYRNRSTRWFERWTGSLVDFFGTEHRVRPELRGAPRFSVLQDGPGSPRLFSALVLSFDLEPDRAYEVLPLLKGRAFVSWTTFEHRADGDDNYRFIVLLPLSRPVPASDYALLCRIVNDELGGVADLSAEPRDRRWALPCCPAERMDFAAIHYGQGEVFDVDALLGYRLVPMDEV